MPPYMIKDKKEVGEGHKAQWTKKSNLPEVTKSWHDYQVRERPHEAALFLIHDVLR